jgi:hypothetical protein
MVYISTNSFWVTEQYAIQIDLYDSILPKLSLNHTLKIIPIEYFIERLLCAKYLKVRFRDG